jgi:hypothetical protein
MQATQVRQASPVRKSNGLWACTFQMVRSHVGEEYVAGELETAGVWFDAGAALVAGQRALEVLSETGRYPNLCEVW